MVDFVLKTTRFALKIMGLFENDGVVCEVASTYSELGEYRKALT